MIAYASIPHRRRDPTLGDVVNLYFAFGNKFEVRFVPSAYGNPEFAPLAVVIKQINAHRLL